MSIFTGWFKKNQPEDYEQILAVIALDIQKRQTRLSEIRLRERRATLNFSVFAFSLWVAYVSLWYMDYLPNLSNHPRKSKFEKTAKTLPVFVVPIIILFIRRIVQIWYNRIGNAEEKSLVTLRKQQREKVEQIKKQTNYYTTKNLLERYDEASSPDSPLRQRFPPQTPQRPIQAPGQPQSRSISQPMPSGPGPQPPFQRGQAFLQPQPQPPQTPVAQISPTLQNQLSPSPQRPLPPLRKQWYDKLADAILGDDDSSSAPVASRYALICQKCFAHNGLVKESMWEDTQYLCPKCGHFNPSARSIREARASRSSSNSASVSATSSPPTILHPLPTGKERSQSRGSSGREVNGVGVNGIGNGGANGSRGDGVRDGEGDLLMEGDSVRMEVDT